MHRFFHGAPAPPQTINVEIGDNFLDGVYRCSHCSESMAQLERFRLENKSFCTYECMAAAFPLAQSNLESVAGRRIIAAPPKSGLFRMKRREWLHECRRGLSDADLQKCEEEGMVLETLQTRKRLQK